ncbi:hypothetical protein [Sorangium sp. So ce341]|uniref:hypothetical protein n=1 Tax=Sorangium sp. So ce341 TaxID=3133302 RepID=UPI003F5E8CB1
MFDEFCEYRRSVVYVAKVAVGGCLCDWICRRRDGSGFEFLPLGAGRRFHPMWNDVYLYVGGGSLLRLFASDRDPRLRLSLVDRFEYYFEADPDGEYGVVAVLRTLLQSGRDSVRVLRVELLVDETCSAEQCVVGALGLEADGGDYLFFFF